MDNIKCTPDLLLAYIQFTAKMKREKLNNELIATINLLSEAADRIKSGDIDTKLNQTLEDTFAECVKIHLQNG